MWAEYLLFLGALTLPPLLANESGCGSRGHANPADDLKHLVGSYRLQETSTMQVWLDHLEDPKLKLHVESHSHQPDQEARLMWLKLSHTVLTGFTCGERVAQRRCPGQASCNQLAEETYSPASAASTNNRYRRHATDSDNFGDSDAKSEPSSLLQNTSLDQENGSGASVSREGPDTSWWLQQDKMYGQPGVVNPQVGTSRGQSPRRGQQFGGRQHAPRRSWQGTQGLDDSNDKKNFEHPEFPTPWTDRPNGGEWGAREFQTETTTSTGYTESQTSSTETLPSSEDGQPSSWINQSSDRYGDPREWSTDTTYGDDASSRMSSIRTVTVTAIDDSSQSILTETSTAENREPRFSPAETSTAREAGPQMSKTVTTSASEANSTAEVTTSEKVGPHISGTHTPSSIKVSRTSSVTERTTLPETDTETTTANDADSENTTNDIKTSGKVGPHISGTHTPAGIKVTRTSGVTERTTLHETDIETTTTNEANLENSTNNFTTPGKAGPQISGTDTPAGVQVSQRSSVTETTTLHKTDTKTAKTVKAPAKSQEHSTESPRINTTSGFDGNALTTTTVYTTVLDGDPGSSVVNHTTSRKEHFTTDPMEYTTEYSTEPTHMTEQPAASEKTRSNKARGQRLHRTKEGRNSTRSTPRLRGGRARPRNPQTSTHHRNPSDQRPPPPDFNPNHLNPDVWDPERHGIDEDQFGSEGLRNTQYPYRGPGQWPFPSRRGQHHDDHEDDDEHEDEDHHHHRDEERDQERQEHDHDESKKPGSVASTAAKGSPEEERKGDSVVLKNTGTIKPDGEGKPDKFASPSAMSSSTIETITTESSPRRHSQYPRRWSGSRGSDRRNHTETGHTSHSHSGSGSWNFSDAGPLTEPNTSNFTAFAVRILFAALRMDAYDCDEGYFLHPTAWVDMQCGVYASHRGTDNVLQMILTTLQNKIIGLLQRWDFSKVDLHPQTVAGMEEAFVQQQGCFSVRKLVERAKVQKLDGRLSPGRCHHNFVEFLEYLSSSLIGRLLRGERVVPDHAPCATDFVHQIFHAFGRAKPECSDGQVIPFEGLETILNSTRKPNCEHRQDTEAANGRSRWSWRWPWGSHDTPRYLQQQLAARDLVDLVLRNGSLEQLDVQQFYQLCPALLQQVLLASHEPNELFADLDMFNEVEAEFSGSTEIPQATTIQSYGLGTASVTAITLCSLIAAVTVTLCHSASRHYAMATMLALAVGSLSGDAVLHLLPQGLNTHSNCTSVYELAGDIEVCECRLKAIALFASMYLLWLLELLTSRKLESLGHSHAPGDKQQTHIKKKYEFTGAAMTDVREMTEVPFPSEVTRPRNDTTVATEVAEFTATSKELVFMIMVGDAAHNMADGLAIGAAFAQNIPLGLSTALAVICHEIPHELGDFAIILSTGMSLPRALLLNLLSALLEFIGLYIGLAAGTSEQVREWMFVAVAGLFLYISFANLIPELVRYFCHFRTAKMLLLQNLGMLTGFGVMFTLVLVEDKLTF
ncbi:hypothetical protein BaRGS_00014361 [Batillaria attramentaria]|uniref:Uncharacterized protein n=1 Tax=Batillaria attramentaria TaxID=370345 RepID=A0ABD0L622_9CAEN